MFNDIERCGYSCYNNSKPTISRKGQSTTISMTNGDFALCTHLTETFHSSKKCHSRFRISFKGVCRIVHRKFDLLLDKFTGVKIYYLNVVFSGFQSFFKCFRLQEKTKILFTYPVSVCFIHTTHPVYKPRIKNIVESI